MKTNLPGYKWFLLGCIYLLSNASIAAATGKNMYAENCQGCHAANGSGSMGWVPDLTDDMAWATMDEHELLNELKLGVRKSGQRMRMPAKGGNPDLSDKNLMEIIHYMRKAFKK